MEKETKKETIGQKILGVFLLLIFALFVIGMGANYMCDINQASDAKNYIFHPTDFYFASNLILMTCIVTPLFFYILYKGFKKESK
jgi:uncharacterized membrane protein YidH (DUF202 family)